MLDERYTAPLSRYSNINKGVPMDAQEEWLNRFPHKRAENKPNGGIVRSIPEITNIREQERKGKDLKAMRAKAWREHKKALKELHKQDNQDAKEIKKQLAVWKAEAAKEAKELAVAEKQELAATKPKTEKTNTPKKKSYRLNNATVMAKKRRDEMAEILKSGGRIELVVENSKADQAAYQMQKKDLRNITESGLNIVRLKSIKTGLSFFVLDTFSRYSGKQVNGTLTEDCRKDLVVAICSGEVLRPDDLVRDIRVGARSMSKLANGSGLNIHTVLNRKQIIGWVLINEQ